MIKEIKHINSKTKREKKGKIIIPIFNVEKSILARFKKVMWLPVIILQIKSIKLNIKKKIEIITPIFLFLLKKRYDNVIVDK